MRVVPPLSWWIEWPAGIVRIGVLFLVAATVVAVAIRYPGAVRDAEREASANSALSYADREIAGGNGLVADQSAVYAARGIIPESDTFHVAVDPAFAGGSDLTIPFVDSYYRYFLLPRRTAEDAPWIICYSCDLSAYGPDVEVVWQGTAGVSIARVGT
jgi:hypothetical protein